MQSDWIPTWERLPDKAGLYLVTRRNPTGVTMLLYKNNHWFSYGIEEILWPGYLITAWQPLPSPCREMPPLRIPELDTAAALTYLKTRSRDLERYDWLMKRVRQVDVSKDREFQRTFDAFYRVRRNEAWRGAYYDLFESLKTAETRCFSLIFEELYKRTGNQEASFASKMLATLEPNQPIWDSAVLRGLNMSPPAGASRYYRQDVCDLYARIEDWYRTMKKSATGKQWIRAFDRAFPQYRHFSGTKKLDFLLWGNR